MELVVILLIVALAIVLIAGGLFLSRRTAKVDKGLPEAPTRPTPTRPAPPPVAPTEAPTAVEPPPVEAPEVEVEPEPEVVERVKPRLRDRLGKTRAAFAGAFSGITGRGRVDDETWDDLEEALILADVGVPTTTKVIDAVREKAKAEKTGDPERVLALLREELVDLLADADRDLRHGDAKPSVWMFVGVNGVAKTTSIA